MKIPLKVSSRKRSKKERAKDEAEGNEENKESKENGDAGDTGENGEIDATKMEFYLAPLLDSLHDSLLSLNEITKVLLSK